MAGLSGGALSSAPGFLPNPAKSIAKTRDAIRALAETCVGLLKKRGDPGAIDRGASPMLMPRPSTRRHHRRRPYRGVGNPRPACLTSKHGSGVASTSAWRSATASSRCGHLAALRVGPARVMTGKPDAPPGLFDRPVLIVDPGMHTAKIWRVFKNTPPLNAGRFSRPLFC